MKKLFCILTCLFLSLSSCAFAQNVVEYDWEEMPAAAPEALQVHFIRVGASDCILLSCGGETMMVDTGNDDEALRALSHLEKEGITHLDYIFITHPHNDHIGGAGAILSTLSVGTIILPAEFEDFSTRNWNALHDQILSAGIPIELIVSQDTMTLGGASLTFYNADLPGETVNNLSMMLRVALGERSVLLTADAENAGQDAVAAEFGSALKSDVIKLAHHGLAPLRPNLRKAVQPEIAVCSNSSGEAKNTLQNVRYHGIECYTTPKGSITLHTEGDVWSLCQWPREP